MVSLMFLPTDSLRSHKNVNFWGEVGWGGLGGRGGVIATQRLAPLLDLHLHPYMNLLLRCLNTGNVDGFWKLAKQAVPYSLPSKKGDARNPQIWKCLRSFQWLWERTGKNPDADHPGDAEENVRRKKSYLFETILLEGL